MFNQNYLSQDELDLMEEEVNDTVERKLFRELQEVNKTLKQVSNHSNYIEKQYDKFRETAYEEEQKYRNDIDIARGAFNYLSEIGKKPSLTKDEIRKLSQNALVELARIID